MKKLIKYKEHHIIMDEVGVYDKRDIAVIKKAAKIRASKTFWLTVTYIYNQRYEEELRIELNDFYIFKDELNIPLRNTASIALTAYNIKKGESFFIEIHVCLYTFCIWIISSDSNFIWIE